ncbi:YadA-like family protein, partial [Psychrobacter urativorans]|uniref:YadA-like family protein n=1 Tax=Psychrobacter urativorans TaxID=45610 RepID=UPI003BB7ED90
AGVTIDDKAGNVTQMTAAGTNVTDGTNTSNYGAAGSTVTDGTNTSTTAANGITVSDQTGAGTRYGSEGFNFVDTNGDIITNAPSITKAGINAGNTVIKNVAAGTVAKDSTDAINGNQLFETNQAIANAQGQANKGFDISADNGTTDNVQLGDTVKYSNTDKNLVATVSDNGINYDLADDISVKTVTANDGNGNVTALTATGTTVTDGINTSSYGAAGSSVTDGTNTTNVAADNITVGGANPVVISGKDGNITGLTNTSYDKTQVVRNRAATEGQVSDVANSLGNLADTPLTFTGNSGTTAQKLGSTLNISGGATAAASNSNIKTVVSNGNIDIQFVDAPTFTGQVKANGFDASGAKIINIANGTAANDAVNKGQLDAIANSNNAKNDALGNSTANNLGGGSKYDPVTGQVTAPNYKVQGGAQNNVGDALDTLDGAINNIKAANESLSNSAVQYDKNADGSINKDRVTLGGGADGTTLTNVKNGKVAKGSKDAITGDQLFQTEQRVESNTTDINNLKNDINNGGVGLVKQDAITQEIKVAADKGGNSVNMSGTAGDRTVSGVKAGAVTAKSNEAVNGSQLHAANTNISNALGGGSKVDASGNITAPSYSVAGEAYTDVGSALAAVDSASLKRFDSLNSRIDDAFYYTNDRIDEVEKQGNAGIAAALSLESAPYIPGKFTYSIGAGYHRGENAIGGSLRRTADSGRWSLTGGVATDSEGGASARIGISGVIN